MIILFGVLFIVLEVVKLNTTHTLIPKFYKIIWLHSLFVIRNMQGVDLIFINYIINLLKLDN